KEVRYASDINMPGGTDGNVYVEYLVPASTASSTPLCVQWRLHNAEGELQRRTWEPSDPAGVSAWATMISDVRNDLSVTSQRPFTFHPAGVDGNKNFTRQRLDVFVDAGMGDDGDGRGGQLEVSFVALNSSSSSETNGGTSTVCLGGGTQ